MPVSNRCRIAYSLKISKTYSVIYRYLLKFLAKVLTKQYCDHYYEGAACFTLFAFIALRHAYCTVMSVAMTSAPIFTPCYSLTLQELHVVGRGGQFDLGVKIFMASSGT